MKQKQEIRRILLKKRNTLTEEVRQKYSKLITDYIFSLKQYTDADTILIYISYKSEVSTYEIIEHALKNGKKVFCPKVLEPGVMEFYSIDSLEEIVLGYKNIPEPKQLSFPYRAVNHSKTIMIVPLVGFDAFKNRLGYGGGFYDRYSEKNPTLFQIALAFNFQKYEFELPCEKTDAKPDIIVTETNCYF